MCLSVLKLNIIAKNKFLLYHYYFFFLIKNYGVIMSTIELDPTESANFLFLAENYKNKDESKDLSQKASTPCLREASKAHFLVTNFLHIPPFGLFGAHQFYAGKPLKGLAMALCCITIFDGTPIGLLITIPWLIRNSYELNNGCFKDGMGKLILPLPTRVTIIDQRSV